MESSGLVRWGAICLILGGAVWLLLGLLKAFDILRVIPGRKDVVLLALALVLTAAGLVGPHALQKESYGLLGRASTSPLPRSSLEPCVTCSSWPEARPSRGSCGRAFWVCWLGWC